jgi:hypothetical protein
MAGSIWMIIYDLDRAHAARYLQWFDEVHIPEKLARPGYTWAAHYQVIAEENTNSSYVAFFGASDSRVFYNPSPAQIKPGQSPETRSMMAYRTHSKMLICSEEWAFDGTCGAIASNPRISAEHISLALFNANENDEDLGAWLVQDYCANTAKSGITRKFLASTGATRHVLVHETGKDEIPARSIVDASSSDWSAQVASYLSYPISAPLLARRVWPRVA